MWRLLSLCYWTSYPVSSRSKDLLCEGLWLSSKVSRTLLHQRGAILVSSLSSLHWLFLYTSYLLNQDKIHRSFPSDKGDYCFHAIVKWIAFLLMRFKAFHILQFHSFCIDTEQSYFLRDICAHFEKEQLCQPLVTLFDLRTLFVPWGQSRWKPVQSLEHLIKKAHEDPYPQQIQKMFGP